MAAVKYELTIAEGMQLELLQFENHIVDLGADQSTSDPLKFKNDKDIHVYPETSEMRIVVQTRNGIINTQWTLTAKVNGKDISENPITGSTDNNGRTDYDKKVKWQ